MDTVLLHSGDTLTFTLQTLSYARNANVFGLAADPTSLRFSLVTAPAAGAGEFAATLSSADASYDVSLDGALGFTAGTLGSSKYRGAVSTVSGKFQFTSAEAGRLFRGNVVHLSLVNLGGDLTLGLPGLLMPSDLYSSLSGDRLTVGALATTASLERAPKTLLGGRLPGLDGPLGSPVPEPGSSALMLGGGALLCGFSALLTRVSRRRR